MNEVENIAHLAELGLHVRTKENPSCPQLWSRIWGSGNLLGEAILGLESLQGTQCLEVGAGMAISSLVASRLGAQVVSTDVSTDALELAEINADDNSISLRTKRLDWYNLDDFLEEELAIRNPETHEGDKREKVQFDLILGSDILFIGQHVRPVAQCVGELLRDGGVALISDPCRPCAETFEDELINLGFAVQVVGGDKIEFAEGCILRRVILYIVWRPLNGEVPDLAKRAEASWNEVLRKHHIDRPIPLNGYAYVQEAT